MNQETIKKYSPYNAKELTREELAAMESFTKDDIKQLAEAYPNNSGTAYLVLKDKSKPEKNQLFPLSTWKNLYELHKLNQTQFVAHSFRSIFRPKAATVKTAPIQDLTKDAAQNELKAAASQTGIPEKKPEGLKPVPEQQTAKEEKEPEKTLSAAQIAEQEGKEILTLEEESEATGSSENPGDEKKPLHKMNLKELQQEFEAVTGNVPQPEMTKAMLVAEINKVVKK